MYIMQLQLTCDVFVVCCSFQLMQLCWGEPHLRPSLRELRIMLLHLLSRKDVVDTSAFDQKWSQLMPKRPPQITQVSDGGGASEPVSNGTVQIVAASGPSPDAAGRTPVARPHDFGCHAPSLHDEMAQVHNKSSALVEETTSPVNELSLDAELSAVGVASMHESSADALLANNVSLEQELAAAQTGQTEAAPCEDMPQDKQMSADRDTRAGEAVPEADSANLDSTVHTKGDGAAEGDNDIVIIDHEANVKAGDRSEQQTVPAGVAHSEQPPDPLGEVSESMTEPASAEVSGVSALELSQSPPEFMTSTPKKDSLDNDNNSDMFLSAIQENTAGTESSTTHSASESSQQSGSVSSSHYRTAQSRLMTQPSLDLSLSYEERSIMAEDKFAAILQTVPMMSFDGDDLEPMPSLDRSVEDEVFNVSQKTTVSVGGAGDATLTELNEAAPAGVQYQTQDGQKEAQNNTGDVERAGNSSEPSTNQSSDTPILVEEVQEEEKKEEEDAEKTNQCSESNNDEEQLRDRKEIEAKDAGGELLGQTQRRDSPLEQDGQKDGERVWEGDNDAAVETEATAAGESETKDESIST